jgi:threonine/homoserine/homoserine lactone efflux protein
VEYNSAIMAIIPFLVGVWAIFGFRGVRFRYWRKSPKYMFWVYRVVGIGLIAYAVYIYSTDMFG